jgi:hypothetical protein
MSFTFTIDWAKAKQYLNYTARIGLIVLFAYAGTSKLIARQGFAHDMMRSLLLPVQAVVVLQWVLPVVELVVVVALIQEPTKLIGFYASAFLMLLFTGYLVALIVVFTYPPCACGGILGGMSYPVHIAFNIFFTLVAVVGIYTSTDDTNEHSAPHTA